MDKEKKYMQVINDNNQVMEYEILLSFFLSKTNRQYIVYTDNTYNENHELNVYAAIYNSKSKSKLEKIVSQEEWAIIDSQIKKLCKNVVS